MTSTRLAFISSVSCVVLWTAKSVAIEAAGGLGRSPAEGPLFLTGFLAFVVGCVAVAVAVTRGRRWWVRVALGLGTVVLLSLPSTLVQLVVVRVQPDHPGWAWSEVNLWVGALVLLAVAARLRAADAPSYERAAVDADPRYPVAG